MKERQYIISIIVYRLCLAAYLFRDITIEDIRTGLQTFIPSESLTPGRLNFFHFKNFTMLADFAHNPHGLKLLCDFISKLDYPTRIGVISGTGDRRDEDIRELGEISAQYFDEIIIRCDKNLRGRTADEIIGLLKEGIDKVNPGIPTISFPMKMRRWNIFMKMHKQGALYTIMCDVVARALDKIRELKQREENEERPLAVSR